VARRALDADNEAYLLGDNFSRRLDAAPAVLQHSIHCISATDVIRDSRFEIRDSGIYMYY
jgi:hypothetical protein